MNDAYDYKYEIALGALSGFSPCCIAWFLIRNKIPHKTRWKHLIEFVAFDKYKSGYIPCPYHALIKNKPSNRCEKCNWKQFFNGSCRLCFMKEQIETVWSGKKVALCSPDNFKKEL